MNSKRSGVHSIDHFALSVPSLEDAERFYRHFGLKVVRGAERLDISAADGHRWLTVLPGERKQLSWISFNCYPEDYAELRQRVCDKGISIDEHASPGFSFSDPDGNKIYIQPGKKTQPDSKQPLTLAGTPADQRGAVTRSRMPVVKPQRLSHILLFTPDVTAAVDFYQSVLGLAFSDGSQELVAFMHARYGCDHHLLAFVHSAGRGFHHVAWNVGDINEVGHGAMQMAAAGYSTGWGTGRHCLGSNYFHYVRDPWGSWCEYSADIDFITPHSNWPAGNFAPHDAFYLWGPAVPEEFICNTELTPH